MKPKKLTSHKEREIARYVRDCQWLLMEKIAEYGTFWFCVWNKTGREQAEDELRCCLLTGMDYLDWIGAHKDWFIEGEWNDERQAIPLQLTEAGRVALQNRHLYEMEPMNVVSRTWVCCGSTTS